MSKPDSSINQRKKNNLKISFSYMLSMLVKINIALLQRMSSLHRNILSYLSTVTKKPMGHGRRPVETLPYYGINIGTDVNKL